MLKLVRMIVGGVMVGLVLQPAVAGACAACYGQSDSPLAQGMNWGILTLLGVIMLVLGGVAAFFVHLARRAAAHAVVVPDEAVLASVPTLGK